jgi:ATP-binding cassette subfamily F protein 3
LIQLHDIGYSIGQRVLLRDVGWVLAPGDRCALVGPNGAGKTTLLRIVLGEITPESGTRVLARGTRLGYLPQEAAERFDGTVLDRALEAHRHVLGMREELDALHQRLQGISPDDPELEPLLERAGELQHHLDFQDLHALEPEARRVLSGLGFSTADQDRPLAEFSGGWRMRAALAALLLTDPTLLFLDEPTNHLDLPAMEWLEDYLDDFHGGLVVVSHDRVFLDRVTDQVRELDNGVLNEYATSFTGYLEERELRRERLEAQNAQLDQKIGQLSRFVERFGAKNTKASQAQSKRKMIERLKSERVVVPRRPRSIHFHFPPPPHAGRTLVRLKDVSFGYGAADVLSRVAAEIERGDKVAIVGANGAGKTTLLRILAGQLEPRAGVRETFPNAKLGYFAQHAAETLDGDATVLAALEDGAPAAWRPRLRSLLGNFLLTGDDVFKLCRVLSGGERQRVALAKILIEEANLLLLDEPTHHLDLAGKEVLEDALAQYPGGVVVVTHDRSLMARLATRVLEVNEGRVRLYPGGYEDYEAARLARIAAESAAAAPAATPAKPAPSGARGAKPPATGGERRGGARDGRERPAGRPKAADGARAPGAVAAHTKGSENREQRASRHQREREMQRIEKDLAEREARVREIEGKLADPELYHDGAQAKQLLGEYDQLRAEVESLWQRLGEL